MAIPKKIRTAIAEKLTRKNVSDGSIELFASATEESICKNDNDLFLCGRCSSLLRFPAKWDQIQSSIAYLIFSKFSDVSGRNMQK
jgi:hypothetical protein